ncbi:hypothetical protein BH09PAT1_BH09PAT1_6450 [soil metagenome]
MGELLKFTEGLIPGRVPQSNSDFYDLNYFAGKKANKGIQFPTDGSFLNPESEYQNKFKDLLDWIGMYTSEGVILDVGTGPGHLKYWSDKLSLPYTVIGTDISSSLLHSCYNLNKQASVISNTYQLPFADEKFQAVLFSDILEHIWPEQALLSVKEAHRILQSNNNIFVNIPNRESWSNAALNDEGHVWLPTIDEVSNMLKLGGFDASSINTFTRGFPNSNEFRAEHGYDLKLPEGGRSIFVTAKKS